jgi:hypothetical protein
LVFSFVDIPKKNIKTKLDYEYSLGKVKDTLFTLTNNFIEVNLKTQRAILHQKNDSDLVFLISTGNPNISEGIETPQGIFTVQNKSPLATSKQFNDAKLFNWIGVSGNVGFHGLEGKKYYATLGKRASSHGCIRISIEDGKILYDKVKPGTPVIVHDNEPARVISFIDSNVINNYKYQIIDQSLKKFRKYVNQRLENLYKGYGFIENHEKFVFNGKYILKGWKFDEGDFKRVPNKQKEPILGSFLVSKFDNLTVSILLDSLYFKKVALKRKSNL